MHPDRLAQRSSSFLARRSKSGRWWKPASQLLHGSAQKSEQVALPLHAQGSASDSVLATVYQLRAARAIRQHTVDSQLKRSSSRENAHMRRKVNQKIYYSILAICYLEVSATNGPLASQTPSMKAFLRLHMRCDGPPRANFSPVPGTSVDNLPALQLCSGPSEARRLPLHHQRNRALLPISPLEHLHLFMHAEVHGVRCKRSRLSNWQIWRVSCAQMVLVALFCRAFDL